MDNSETIIWLIALVLTGIVVCLFVYLFRERSAENHSNGGTGSSGSDKTGPSGAEKSKAGPLTISMGSPGEASAGGRPSSGNALYIPPEMTSPAAGSKKSDLEGTVPGVRSEGTSEKDHKESKSRDTENRDPQDQDMQGKAIPADPEKDIAVIYRSVVKPYGWACPFCEAENEAERQLCCACGQRRRQG